MKVNNDVDFDPMPSSLQTNSSNTQSLQLRADPLENSTIASTRFERNKNIEEPVLSLSNVSEAITLAKQPKNLEIEPAASRRVLQCIQILRRDLEIVNKSVSFSDLRVNQDSSQLQRIILDIQNKIEQHDYIIETETRCQCTNGCLLM